MTCLHIASYEQGADQGIAVLALQTSIIWGVLFDWVFFKNTPSKGQVVGVGVLLLATYSAVDFPGLYRSEALPWWVWIKLLIAFMLGINEMTRRKLAEEIPGETRINPVVSSFYVGSISLTFLVPLIIANAGGVFKSMSLSFFLSSALLGWLVVISTVLSLIPYLAGSNILLRKFFGNATALTLSILSGALIFNEAITLGKVIGFGLVVVSFLLFDRERLLLKELFKTSSLRTR
jgi:drug/metabolite transporter (DMT)-like permease